MQPETVDFNEAGEVRKSKAEVIPSGTEKVDLKDVINTLILHCMMVCMPLIQLQMFKALVIWQVQLQRLQNQN